jgi:tuberculosinol/isotuberculosinol synthase
LKEKRVVQAQREEMTIEEFQRLPVEDIARLVHEKGPKVCVFPINGTRRWLLLEYPDQISGESFAEQYLHIAGRRHIELYKLFFDHGVETLLTPIFGPDILERQGYDPIAERGLTWFTQNREFLEFYDAYDVRARVYGDARRYLEHTPYTHALEAFDQLAERTASHRRYRLFFGVCAQDATETIAEISVRFYQEHNCLPNRHQIVEAYYGEYIEPVNLFIGFDRLAAFDMPLLATGTEDLYFTVSPSPYLDARSLRAILYDHLYTRRIDDTSYAELPSEEWARMKAFYGANLGNVIGIGKKPEKIWYPLPQVTLLDNFVKRH